MTLHDDRTNVLKPLYGIEENILTLVLNYKDTKDYKYLNINVCNLLLDKLAGKYSFFLFICIFLWFFFTCHYNKLLGFTLDKFALRQHRRVLELLRMISKLGHDIPIDDDRYCAFKTLRNKAKTQFTVYKVRYFFKSITFKIIYHM